MRILVQQITCLSNIANECYNEKRYHLVVQVKTFIVMYNCSEGPSKRESQKDGEQQLL